VAKINVKRRSHLRDRCDHDWVTEVREVLPSRSHAHPLGPAPAEHERVKVCKKCSAERGGRS
jgi:hypothetical protein